MFGHFRELEARKVAGASCSRARPQGDPFDRVIVATARRNNLPLLTRDQAITESGLVKIVW